MKNKIYLILIFIFVLTVLLAGCQKNITPTIITGFYFDTVITVTIYDEAPENLESDIHDFLNHYDALLSEEKPDSDINIINNNTKAEISDDTSYLLKQALSYAALSEGVLDPTIMTVSDIYNFDTENHPLPDMSVIEEKLSHTGYKKIHIDNNTFSKDDPETKIGLGFIAKGYIADRLADLLKNNGINNALINLGGNILTIGNKPDSSSFIIGIEKPFSSAEAIKTLHITNTNSNTSVVTSGIYERYFTNDDKLYHHLIDTASGLPLDNELLSCTIIGPESETCDILSTLCYLYGYDKSIEYLTEYPDYHCIYVFRDYSVKYSNNFPTDILSN